MCNISDLLNKKIVLDALHLVPSLLEAIHQAKGTYLIGLKANQRLLRRLCLLQTLVHKPAFERVDAPLRGHRLVQRRVLLAGDLDVGQAVGQVGLEDGGGRHAGA